MTSHLVVGFEGDAIQIYLTIHKVEGSGAEMAPVGTRETKVETAVRAG